MPRATTMRRTLRFRRETRIPEFHAKASEGRTAAECHQGIEGYRLRDDALWFEGWTNVLNFGRRAFTHTLQHRERQKQRHSVWRSSSLVVILALPPQRVPWRF